MRIRTLLVMILGLLLHYEARRQEPQAFQNKKLEIQRDNRTVSIVHGTAPVMRYRYSDVPRKPYVQELYSPSGIQILRDAPHDHLHHHGMMFAIIGNGIDFWTEGEQHGTQDHVQLGIKKEDPGDALSRLAVTHELTWKSHDGSAILHENRSVGVHALPSGTVTLITWRSVLQPAEKVESVTLTGTHYDGLGLRFIESMDRMGRFVHAAGERGPLVRGTEHVTPSKWSAYIASANGKPVTVVVFDHPDNPRHPAGMFSMTAPFAYLSATPNIWKKPQVLVKGSSICYRYGVALWDGETPPEEIEKMYAQWLGSQ